MQPISHTDADRVTISATRYADLVRRAALYSEMSQRLDCVEADTKAMLTVLAKEHGGE